MSNNFTKSTKVVRVYESFKAIVFKLFLLVLFSVFSYTNVFASATTDYFRSVATGNWGTTTTWQSSPDNVTWSAATLTPTNAANTITLQSPFVVKVAAIVTADQIVVNNGATLTMTAVLTLANGVGTDLQVDGIFSKTGGGNITINAGAVINVSATGKYIHNTTGAISIPTATWATTSTCEIQLTNATAPTASLGQSFGNFIWNSSAQTGNVNLTGALTTILGNFSIFNTNGYNLYLNNSATTKTINVTGNFICTTASAFDYVFINYNSGGNTILNVGGNATINGSGRFGINNGGAASVGSLNITGNLITGGTGNFYGIYINGTTTATANLSVTGDLMIGGSGYFYGTNGGGNSKTNFTITGNTLVNGTQIVNLDYSSSSTASTFNFNGNLTISAGVFAFGAFSTLPNVNVKGNFTKNGGTFACSNQLGLNGVLTFSGTGSSQTISNNTNNDSINYIVNNGAYVVLSGSSTAFPLGASSTEIFTINSGGTIDCGTSYLSGTGTFNLLAGGTIKIGDVINGITTTGNNTGNIRCSTARNFNVGGIYEYNGLAAQASTGNSATA
jgi:hypothetical protein